MNAFNYIELNIQLKVVKMVTFISFYHNRKNNSANESPSLFFPREFNLTVSVSMAKIASFHQYSFFFSFIIGTQPETASSLAAGHGMQDM